MDQIKSQLDNLAELSDEQVAELQNQIISQFESVEGNDPTPETVDAMTSLADSLDTVRGELSRREAQAAELAAQAAEASARVKGASDSQNDGEAMSEDYAEKDVPAETETPAETTAEGGQEEAPVAPADAAPAETPAAPAETPGQVEGSPEEEAKETPEEEKAEPVTDEEKKKKESFASDSEDASTVEVEGSELSTTDNTPTETTNAPEEQEEQAPVTASAEQPFEAPADRQPVIQVSEVATVAITAGADIPGYTAGSAMNDMNEVSSAMEKRIHSLRRVNGGDGEQHIVASFSTMYPEARSLGTDALSNQAKIDAVVGQEALTASGGHVAPQQVKYDIYAIGSTNARPVRDSLPKFQADRGGIRFVTPPSFADGSYDAAVGIWTAATDTAPYANTKTSLTVQSAQENTVTTDAITLQLKFGNLMTRAYPELIARHNELALVQHAREAEQNLLSKIGNASTAVTTTSTIGLGRDFLVQVRRAAIAYRNRHRIDPGTQLKAIVPQWLFDAMASDLTLAVPGDNTIAIGQSEIEGYLAQSNVTLVGSPDLNVWGSQSAGAINAYPSTFDWFLFAEGTFLFLDGGTLDLGIIRDSTLVGTNDYKMFVETFENVAKVGIESLKVTSTYVVKGTSAAAVTGVAY